MECSEEPIDLFGKNHEKLHKGMAQHRGAEDRVRTQLCSSVDRMRNGFKYKHDWECVVFSKWWNGLFRLGSGQHLCCHANCLALWTLMLVDHHLFGWMFKLSQQANDEIYRDTHGSQVNPNDFGDPQLSRFEWNVSTAINWIGIWCFNTFSGL